MNTQLQLDWTQVVHRHENNPSSENHLHKNIFHFTGQCAILLSLLQKGIKITAREAMLSYGIGHLARRIKDLRDHGINIQDHYVDDSRYKEYFL